MADQPQSKHAFGDDVLGDQDAVGLADLIRSGQIQASEAVEAAVGRAEQVEPALNAVAAATYESAVAQARRPRQDAGSGVAGAVFAGVPTYIKDTDDLLGVPTRMGSRGMPETPAAKTSRFVRQFLSTGLVSLGKTTIPELGLTGTTESVLHGPTCNPWDLHASTGGSSGGSSALVAAGVVPLAHANDGAGSIRIPASCCGLVGLKPSRGRLCAIEGSQLLPVRILTQGMVSRTVRDTAAFYAAAERYFRDPKLPPIGHVEQPTAERLKIALFTQTPDGSQIDEECAGAAADAAALCLGLGHDVEEIGTPFEQGLLNDFYILWATMAWSLKECGRYIVNKGFDKTRVEDFTSGMARHFRGHLGQVPGAMWRLRRFAAEYASLLGRYDVLLTPTLATPPPQLGYLGPQVPFDTALERLEQFIAFTPIQNVAGAPAISLPLGRSRGGRPIGIQFAAALGQDRRLLELALQLEEAAPWPRLGDAGT